MTIDEIFINLLTHVFKIVATLTFLASATCAKKASIQEKTVRSEKQVLVLKSDRPKTPEKQAKSSKKEKAESVKSEKKIPSIVVPHPIPTNDGHKSIEVAVAEGLILDPKPFKNEGNLDARTPKHPKFGEELQRIIENPISNSSETSGSSCSEDNNERKRDPPQMHRI